MIPFVLAAALACIPPQPVAKSAAAHSTYEYDGLPPKRFQGNASFSVMTHTPDEVARVCDEGPPTCGYVTDACTIPTAKGAVIHMPNPCGKQFRGDSYAKLLCHEAGHVSGWPASHGD